MILYAVIDTNILVSALLTLNPASPTKAVLNHVRRGNVTPMINSEIIEEYDEVLSRSKFNFARADIEDTLNLFLVKGENCTPNSISGRHHTNNQFIREGKQSYIKRTAGRIYF